MSYSVVPMTAEHLEDMSALEQRCFSMPWSRDMLAGELDKEYALYLVAEDDDGRLAGYAGVHIIIDEGCITNVAVAPEHRRRGVADALMTALLRQGGRRGAESFNLEVRRSNAAAIALYQKHGFVTVGARRGYYSYPAEDALIMIKKSGNTKNDNLIG